jgi:outer membrane protein TolC
VHAGIPSMLLRNRPDVRKAELQLAAAKLDVKAARANFYPSLSLSAGIGYRAFNPAYLIQPEGLIYNLAGDLMAPLVNRNAIRANYQSANERQIQELLRYEQTILNAYVEVVNQLAQVENSSQGLKLKTREVDILMQSVDIANNLFRFARADYLEILLTQREALKSKMELMEIKLKQMNARVNVYRALGGGWN